MLKKIIAKIIVYWIAIAIILMDQYTKHLARENLQVKELWDPFEWLSPYFRITRLPNTGAAFGMFQRAGNVFTILAIVVIIAILYYSVRLDENEWGMRIAMGLQLGGAAGNLIDRINFGEVTNFISFMSFPVTTVADISIAIGAITIVLDTWLRERISNKG